MKQVMLSLAVLLGSISIGSAAPIYGTPADLTGSRTEGNFVTGGNYAGKNLQVDWTITFLGGVTWQYSYTFSGFSQPEISHMILDLSDNAVDPRDPNAVTDLGISSGSLGSVEYGTFSSSPSNPGFPSLAEIVGVKINTNDPGSSFVIDFKSNRAPVWGDLYIKGGSSSFAYNNGLTLHSTSDDPLDFLARPDGVVPEPGSLALAGIGLATLGLLRRRVRNRRALD